MSPESSHNPFWDLIIIVALIVFLWFGWVAMGGPAKFRAKEEGLLINPLSTDSSAKSSSGASSGSTQAKQDAEASPYAPLISLRMNAAGTSPEKEYIELVVSSAAKNPITLTGWTLSSGSSIQAVIGQGTSILSQGMQPYTEPIVLIPGAHAHIVTGRSPVGTSFQTNICSGYLEEYQSFTPSITKRCPSGTKTATAAGASLDASCKKTLGSFSQCTTKGNLSSATSPQCVGFIREYMSYNGCVRVYKNTPAFSDGTWYVYLERISPLWPKKGTLILKDIDGKIVKEIKY
ncbi:MAG: hypothetical protein HGA67_03970 [Candidatus Yonathbacteria bacterium]|nr:hypothetical protein [Candidatus Yonathbacteria bacterium]